MTWRHALWSSLFLGTMFGCYLSQGETGGTTHHKGGSGNPYTGPLASVPGDIPCDVASALLICQSCHGSTPSAGAPMSLVSRADLMADSLQYPGQSQAQRAVARMLTAGALQMPPPPASPSPQTDVDALNAWIAAGYPAGNCGGTTSVCTSGLAGGTSENAGAEMRPGEACIACHSQPHEAGNPEPTGPLYTFMGTVFPTLHEPNDCIGASSADYSGAQVIMIDAQGKQFALTPNSAGNFLGSPGSFTMPFTAKVTYQGREIAMVTPQTSGDCNSCHTELGANGAPGRIHLP